MIAQEGAALIDEIESDGDGYLDWDAFNLCVRRITLRAVLGDDARDDGRVFELLSKLMEEANGLPKERSEHYEPFRRRIEGYVSDPEPESLVGLFADAPAGPDTDPAGQVPHWLFACGDTLAINAYRALALITTHPEQRARVVAEVNEADTTEADDVGSSLTAAGIAGLDHLEACVEDAMRLYPTTPLLSRETDREVALERRRDPRRDPDPDLEHVQPPRPRAASSSPTASPPSSGSRAAPRATGPSTTSATGPRAARGPGSRSSSPRACSLESLTERRLDLAAVPTSTRARRCRRCSTSSRCASRAEPLAVVCAYRLAA